MAPTKWDSEQPAPNDESKYSPVSSMGPQRPVRPGKGTPPVDPAKRKALLRKIGSVGKVPAEVTKKDGQTYKDPYK